MQVPRYHMIHDVAIRWNSTFFMIEQLIEQHWPVMAILADQAVNKPEYRSLDLKTEDWALFNKLNPHSTYISGCPLFKNSKFLDSHPYVDLVIAITSLLRRVCRSDINQWDSNKPSQSNNDSALDILLGSDSPSSLEDSEV